MHLNYLPLRFTSDVFRGGVLVCDGSAQTPFAKNSPAAARLKELRKAHESTHFFYLSAGTINCVPLVEDAPTIGMPKAFDIFADFQLANALARSALLQFFELAGQTVVRHRPVTIVLEQHNLSSMRQDIFGIFPEYELDVRPLAPHEGKITSGVLIGFGIRYQFQRTIAQLVAAGLPVTGLYAVHVPEEGDEESLPGTRRYLGRIEAVQDNIVRLSDSDFPEFESGKCFLEGSRTWRLSAELCSDASMRSFLHHCNDRPSQ